MNVLYFFAASISLKCGIMLFDIFSDESLVAIISTLTFSVLAFLGAHMTVSFKKGKTASFIVFSVLSVLCMVCENMFAVGELELMTFRTVTLMYLVDLPLFAYLTFFGEKLISELKKRHIVEASVFIFAFFISFVVIWNIREKADVQTTFENTAETVYAKNGYTKSEYFGSGEGKHVVILEVPSLCDAVLETEIDGEPLLPNFKSFFEETLYFESFYTETYDGSIDIQFATLNSLFPTLDNTIAKYHQNTFNSLSNVLSRNGYSTEELSSFDDGTHNRGALLRSLGFDRVEKTASDSETLQNIVQSTSGRVKTFQYAVLSTSARPYVSPNHVDTKCKTEIDSMIDSLVEADRLFGEFVEKMKKEGGYEKTVIVVFGTATELSIHKRGSLSSYGSFCGRSIGGYETYEAPMGIRIPSIKPSVKETISSIYDVFPTVMDILGMSDENMLVYGDSALRGGDMGVAYITLGDAHRGSFVDGDHIYIKARNGNDQIFNNSDKTYASTSSCLPRSKQIIRMIGECELFYEKNIFKNMTPSVFSEIAEKNERVTLIFPEQSTEETSEFYRDELLESSSIITVDKLTKTTYNLKMSGSSLVVKNVLDNVDRVTSGVALFDRIVGKESVTVAPFGDGEIYCSFLIEGEYTDFLKMSSLVDDEKVTVSLGKAVAKNKKTIERVKIAVLLEGDDELFGINLIVGEAASSGKAPEKSEGFSFKENEFGFIVNGKDMLARAYALIESKLLGVVSGDTFSSVCELIGAMKKRDVLVFFDQYDKNTLKFAIEFGSLVSAITEDGTIWPIVGYENDVIYSVGDDGAMIEFNEKEWKGRVMVAVNNDKELVIIEDFIPIEALIRPGYVNNDKKYIVIHNTGNYAKDSDAALHALYLHNQAASSSPREASWHYTVDDKVVYYHIPDNENAWHASDGNFGNGNYHGIGIEICVNGFPEVYSGAAYENWLVQFKATLDNAAKLTAHLMVKYDLDMSSIKQHYDFARDKKNCPMQMRWNSKTQTFERDTGDMWIYFLEKTEEEWKKLENK